MGIVNMTPDSFSKDGLETNVDKAMRQIERFIKEGVDIIDIGGESTRPGHQTVSESEELDRVLPLIQKARTQWEIPLSIDTTKAKVAQIALDAGVDMINDIWGTEPNNPRMKVAAAYGVPIILMHNRTSTAYPDLISTILKEMDEMVGQAEQAGIASDHVIIDPGIGFGKTPEQNIIVLQELKKMHRWDLPVLLGASRKSVVGYMLDLPVEDRLEGTLGIHAWGIVTGMDILRVHDVKETKRMIRVLDRLTQRKKGEQDYHG